jgi:hypothetical protein
MSPEHLHLLINHIVLAGFGCALLPLLIGLMTRSYPALISGLLLAFICGWAIFLVNQTGDQAEQRFQAAAHHQIRLDEDALRWVDTHKDDARFFGKMMYASAGFATLGLLLCVARSSWAYPVGWLVFILCAGSLVTGFMIADSGYKIRRPDLRVEYRLESGPEGLTDPVHRRLDVLA